MKSNIMKIYQYNRALNLSSLTIDDIYRADTAPLFTIEEIKAIEAAAAALEAEKKQASIEIPLAV